MKNTKEIRTIFAILYYLNRLGNKDNDIENVLNYAFYRIFQSNTNLLLLACIGHTKEDSMPEIEKILKTETKYFDYIKFMEDLKK